MSMWRLISNPVYIVTCLGACSELIIVSGFLVFLPKYLETQFSIGKSQASVFTGCKYFICEFYLKKKKSINEKFAKSYVYFLQV